MSHFTPCHTFNVLKLAYYACLPAGKSLVCTVWFHEAHNFPNLPQRLGIVYCLNRPCSLYSIKIPFTCKNNTPSDSNPQAKCLTEGMLSAMSPKFSPGGDKLIFLSHDAAASSRVHHATAALKCIYWSEGHCSSLHATLLLWLCHVDDKHTVCTLFLPKTCPAVACPVLFAVCLM